MRKQCLPDTEFELVHEIDHHHLGYVEFLPQFESFTKGILPHIQSGCVLTAEEDISYNGWDGGCHLEQSVNASTRDSMASPIY